MKKKLIIFLSALLLISVCGCAKEQDTSAEGSASGTASVQTDESSEEPLIIEPDRDKSEYEFSLDNKKPYDSVEEYLNSDSAKEILKKLEGPDEQGVIITKIYAEKGTCLVFERRISKDLNMWLEEGFESNLAKDADADKETFKSLVDSLEACINRKNITVAVRYLDPDGKLLYEIIYDNDGISGVQQSKASASESSTQQSKASAPESSTQQSKAYAQESSTQQSKNPG